jgi:HK97 family phage major capsid protein
MHAKGPGKRNPRAIATFGGIPVPLLKFLKNYEGNKPGDPPVIIEDKEDAAYLVKKGIAEEVPAEILDGAIKKAFDEGMATHTPKILDGMTGVLTGFMDSMKESVKTLRAPGPAVVWDEGDNPIKGSSLLRKSAAETCSYEGLKTKSFPRKKTQDVFKSLGHLASVVQLIPVETLKAAERGGVDDYHKIHGLPYQAAEFLNFVRKSDEYQGSLVTKADPTGLGESISSEAGILVPPEFSMQIFERVYGNPLLQMTDTYPINSNSMKFLANAERSRADGSRKGGVRGYWKGEAAQYTASKPTFRDITLTPHKLTVMVYATDELMEDSAVSLDQYLSQNASDEINFKVGDALLNGTGSGQPLGWLNAAATVSVSKETSQAAATIVSQNILKMWARMYAPARLNSVWLYNQNIETQLQQMSLAIGSGGALVYTPPGGLSSSPYASLMGRPMLPTEFNAGLGTVGDIMLVDMGQLLTCTRGGIKSAMSLHLRFDYDEAAFKFSFRVDGQPWWDAPLTPYKGTSDTQSVCITLATRS